MTVRVSGIVSTVMHYGRNRRKISAPGAVKLLYSFNKPETTEPVRTQETNPSEYSPAARGEAKYLVSWAADFLRNDRFPRFCKTRGQFFRLVTVELISYEIVNGFPLVL